MIHVILDNNYVIHKSHVVRAALQTMGNTRLHFLPPYCPNKNRIERIWLDAQDNVTRNHRWKRMKALMREIHRYLARFAVSTGLSIGA